MAKRSVLVAGGAGYIGSHVSKVLQKNGYEVVIFDNLSTGFRELAKYGAFVEGDISDSDKLLWVIDHYKVEGILNFAGSIIVPESVEKPIEYYKNNTVNSLNLLECALKKKINRFVFSSTAAVYGLGADRPLKEEDSVNPINPYGRSKLMTEWMLEDASKAYKDFNYVALRYFNVCGADSDGELGQCSKLATHLIKLASQTALGVRKKLSLFGTDYNTPDGTCIRDYIHVWDLAMAHLDAMNFLFEKKESHVLNCGPGVGNSVREVIESVKKVTQTQFIVEETNRRPGDGAILVADNTKIKKVLGWAPRLNNLDIMVDSAYQWEKKLWNVPSTSSKETSLA